MRLRAASIITLLVLAITAPAFAIEAPRIVPRLNEIQKPVDEVYATVRRYFTDGLGDNQNKVACTSKFVLEDDILAAASAATGK